MEYLFSEKRYTLLYTNKPEMSETICPTRMEVSIFGNGNIHVSELFETPDGIIISKSSYHTMENFKDRFKEAADLIEQREKKG